MILINQNHIAQIYWTSSGDSPGTCMRCSGTFKLDTGANLMQLLNVNLYEESK